MKIDKSNLALQIACAVLILGAYFVSKALMLVAGIICMAYIFSTAKWEQKIAFFMFVLSFSPIFKFDKDQTSLFMFLRIAMILIYMFRRDEKLSFKFITVLIAFVSYGFILSELHNTDYLVHLINMILWILAAYVIVNTLKINNITPVVRSLINGIILTGIIGLFINDIPQLNEEIQLLNTYAEDGAIVYRFAAFWGDPNYYTILLIVAIWSIYFEYNRKKVGVIEFLCSCMIMSFLGMLTMSKSCILLLVIFWIYVVVSKNEIKTTAKVTIIFIMFFSVVIFLLENPYWISDIFYRFNNTENTATLNTITTGRTDLWLEYINSMLDDFSWMFGNGVNAELITISGVERGSHNTYIELVYTFGIAGTLMFLSLFKIMCNSVKKNRNLSLQNRQKGPEKFAFISILVTLVFLNGLHSEMYYYMLSLSFVYMLGDNSTALDSEENLNEKTVI